MRRCVLVMILIVMMPMLASAANLYVTSGGSGSGSCLTGTPCSLQRAFDIVNPGDHIKLRSNAIYDDYFQLSLSHTGTSGAGRIYIEPDDGATPVLRRSNPNASEGVINLVQVSYVTVQGLTFDGAGVHTSRYGLYIVSNPSGGPTSGVDMFGIEVLNNTFQNWGGTAAQATTGGGRAALLIGGGGCDSLPCSSGSGVPQGAIVRGNTFLNNRQSAGQFSHQNDLLVENNEVSGTTCGRDVDATNTIGFKIINWDTPRAIFRNNHIHDFEPYTSCGIDDSQYAPNEGYPTLVGIWCDVGPQDGIAERNLIHGIIATGSVSDRPTSTSMNIEYGCYNWIVRNNVIYNMDEIGISHRLGNDDAAGWGGPPTQFLNNTISGNSIMAIGLGIGPAIIKNNVLQSTNSYGLIKISLAHTGAYQFSNNQFYDTQGTAHVGWIDNVTLPLTLSQWQAQCDCGETNSAFGNPLLAAAGSGDLRLCTASGQPVAGCAGASPAINAGATLSNVPNDYLGRSRPGGAAYDIGAYESDAAGVGPVAWWRADEGGGTSAADSTGNGHTGTLCQGVTCPYSSNGPTFVSGQVANAVHCDGTDDNVQVAHAADLDLIGDMTIAFWLNLRSTTHLDSVPQPVVIGKESASEPTPWLVYLTTAATPHLAWYHHTTSGDFSSSPVFTADTIPVNSWRHIAMVRTISDKTVKYYLNGVEVSNACGGACTWTTDAPQASGAQALMCVSADRASLRYANIDLDEVKIFNRALSPQEVAVLVTGGAPATPVLFFE